jgi:hypothetical protein
MSDLMIKIIFYTSGTAGAVLVLLAFFLNQMNRWKADDFAYDAANFFGGLLLVIYATWISAWPFLMLNSVWTIYSLFDMIGDIKRDSKIKLPTHK